MEYMNPITDEEKNRIWASLHSKDLLKAFLSLHDEEEAKSFFRDLMTEKEIAEFDMRWEVAKLLDEGKTFTEIEQLLGITAKPITRVNKWLKEGTGGYKMMIERMKEKQK
jgi:TrpR-related protein YerC/YecD